MEGAANDKALPTGSKACRSVIGRGSFDGVLHERNDTGTAATNHFYFFTGPPVTVQHLRRMLAGLSGHYLECLETFALYRLQQASLLLLLWLYQSSFTKLCIPSSHRVRYLNWRPPDLAKATDAREKNHQRDVLNKVIAQSDSTPCDKLNNAED